MIKVRIKDYEYQIKFITEEEEEDIEAFADAGDIRYLGLCDMAEQVIYIISDIQKEERMLETIKHEISHAFIDSYCLKNEKDKYSEEFICDFVAAYSSEINKLADDIYKQYTYKLLNAKTKELEGDITAIHE